LNQNVNLDMSFSTLNFSAAEEFRSKFKFDDTMCQINTNDVLNRVRSNTLCSKRFDEYK
jgi:hypothetical protein